MVSDSPINARINAAREALDDSGDRQAVVRTFPRRGFRFVATSAMDAGAGATEVKTDNPTKPSIAVMPFETLSPGNEHDYFADGMTEDLVTSLSRIGGFFVSGRNSTFAYKDTPKDVRTIVGELGIRYLLTGSVRISETKIRASVSLITGNSGERLCAKRYDRILTDIFEIQDEITASIIGQLAPELYAAEDVRLRKSPARNLDAWEHFIRGLHQYSQQTAKSSTEAVASLEQAVTFDPSCAQALGLLAMTVSWRAIQRLEPFDEALARASGLASRALQCDSNNP